MTFTPIYFVAVFDFVKQRQHGGAMTQLYAWSTRADGQLKTRPLAIQRLLIRDLDTLKKGLLRFFPFLETLVIQQFGLQALKAAF